MIVRRFLALVVLVLVGSAPSPASSPLTADILARVNELRAVRGLDALLDDPTLAAVAVERARAAAFSGSATPSHGSIAFVSRSLLQRGYHAGRWRERLVVGTTDPHRILYEWSRSDRRSFEDVVYGDFVHAGVAVADDGAAPTVAVLVALPAVVRLEREARPLGDREAVRRRILQAVNELRGSRRLPSLAPAADLDAVAQHHAEDMLLRAYYDHRTPEGTGPLRRVVGAGLEPRWLGENIAKGHFTPVEVVSRWEQSSGHRRNMLSPRADEIGLGVAFGSNANGFEVLWVMLLAESDR